MTNEQFKSIRESLGWTQQEIADKIGKDLRTAQRYEYGETPIPKTIELLLTAITCQDPT